MNGNINEFLGAYDLPKLDQEDIKTLTISMTSNEIEAETESPNKEWAGLKGVTVKSTKP
jgi:hypothetical protein